MNDPRFASLPSKKQGVPEAALKDDRFKGGGGANAMCAWGNLRMLRRVCYSGAGHSQCIVHTAEHTHTRNEVCVSCMRVVAEPLPGVLGLPASRQTGQTGGCERRKRRARTPSPHTTNTHTQGSWKTQTSPQAPRRSGPWTSAASR